jgi:hypothetical protein
MKISGIITLLTDFGLSDPYVAMMKGVILSINPDARLIDISHKIRVGSILQAGSLIRETYPFFPRGTVHVVVVDPGVGSNRRLLGLEAGGHFFVGPDNGIFWPLIKDHKGARIINLIETQFFLSSVSHTFHGRDIFAPAAAHLTRGVDLAKMGPRIRDPLELHFPKPKVKGEILYGQITRVDNFGNLITNIHRADLKSFLESNQPVIKVGDWVLEKLNLVYADAKQGETLALLDSSDWLEIAVNLGRASDYLGMDLGDIIGTEVKVSKFR